LFPEPLPVEVVALVMEIAEHQVRIRLKNPGQREIANGGDPADAPAVVADPVAGPIKKVQKLKLRARVANAARVVPAAANAAKVVLL